MSHVHQVYKTNHDRDQVSWNAPSARKGLALVHHVYVHHVYLNTILASASSAQRSANGECACGLAACRSVVVLATYDRMQSTSALPPTERADDWDPLSEPALEKGPMQIHSISSLQAPYGCRVLL